MSVTNFWLLMSAIYIAPNLSPGWRLFFGGVFVAMALLDLVIRALVGK